MIIDNLRFRVARNLSDFGYSIHIAVDERRAGGGLSGALPVVCKKIEPGDYVEPTIHIGDDQATMLMDELWSAGVRPSNGEGNIGQIGALKTHLDDMRMIAFTQLGLSHRLLAGQPVSDQPDTPNCPTV